MYFMGELDNLLGGGSFEEFSKLDNFKRTGFVYKPCLRMWVHGQWRKYYSSDMNVLFVCAVLRLAFVFKYHGLHSCLYNVLLWYKGGGSTGAIAP